jgi:hypothetical protein
VKWDKWNVTPFTRRLIAAARRILKGEQTRIREGGDEDAQELIKQMKGMLLVLHCPSRYLHLPDYMYRRAPFNTRCGSLDKRRHWWEALLEDDRSRILAVSE